MKFKYQKAALVGIILAVNSLLNLANAGLIVAPNEYSNTEADGNNCYPFSCEDGFNIYRYQQIYNSSLLGSKSGIIEEIRFRLDGGSSSFSDQWIDLEIRLSNTDTTAATLSTTFSDNIGNDEALVLNRTISLSSVAILGVNPFDIVIDVADIFTYDGTSNLLLDVVRISGGGADRFFDAVDEGSSSLEMGRVFSEYNTPTGTIGTYSHGLITQFKIATDVPEPTTLAIFALGMIGLASRRFKKQA